MTIIIFQMSQMYAPQYDPQRNGGQVKKLPIENYRLQLSVNGLKILDYLHQTGQYFSQIYPGYGAAMYTNMYHR